MNTGIMLVRQLASGRLPAKVLALILAGSQLAVAADLSPGKWTPEERARLEQLERSPSPRDSKVVQGQSGVVAATMSPTAAHAGITALEQGGTAADAAATVALTQIATALGSYVSYAGIMRMVYYEAKSGKVYTLNAPWNSYLGETEPKTIPTTDVGALPAAAKPITGAEGRKTLVPGFMAGIEEMHRRFGRLPFADLFQPAIWYANNGVRVSPLLTSYFGLHGKYLSTTQEGRRFLGQAGSSEPRAGDLFVQPDLAATLRAVAKKGAAYMYTGAWGRQFVEAVRRKGGKATLADMKRYKPTWEDPLPTDFMGHTVLAAGKSGLGAIAVLEALNLAEELKLDKLGPYYNDARAFRDLSRILQLVEFDTYGVREVASYKHSKDISFSPEARITKDYARRLAPILTQFSSPGEQGDKAPHHSDAVVVVDRWGNVAALVHSINAELWGTTGIVVGGVPIGDPAGFQQGRLATLKPGDPVPNEITPVIVMDGAKPVFAIATIGSSLIAETVRLLVGTFANHLDAQPLMAAPPMLNNFNPWRPGDTIASRIQLVPAGAYQPDFQRQLREAGVNIELRASWQTAAIKGIAVIGIIDPKTGVRRSVETPGVFDFAEAY
ncbi:MAG TPA: gamma-glutamyltransferase [Blastocatellia bacterium]|nr:gamma-glutamyltransferase [Blastocatellia bacterium]